MRFILAIAALPIVLAACGERADEAATPEGTEAPMPVEPDGGIGDGATPAGASPPPGPNGGGDAAQGAIPGTVQGRWGLTAADCTSTRGDAKGLLTVSADTLTFYESVGRLAAIKDRTDDRIRANFAFTGEGMTWTRDVALTVADGGRTLVRREFGEDAATEAFRYTRCS